MHGWGCDHTTVGSIARVASRTHTVYNLDMPGFGASPEPAGIWGVDDYTRLVEGFIARLGLERPMLVGHSFGGRVSILLASRNDSIDAIVLVDAAGIKPKRTFGYYRKVYSFKAAKWLASKLLPAATAARLTDMMRKSRGSSDYASASEKMRAIMSRVVNEDLTGRLPLIKAPTLLIWGSDDTATPIADARKMERLIPDAALVEFGGCGHYSFLDNPGQFAAVMASFLNSRIQN
ncbi:MAG: alpha/beta hydrolase [Muribaculaceae bacterium]|nr:alpha/beta hydrolase [Muribaculaceae bacterium]